MGATSVSLYHYTSLEAIKSILSNKKIWLTDIRFMNDSQEHTDGLNVLSNVLENGFIPGVFSNFDYVDEAMARIEHLLVETSAFGIDEEPIFVFSFSAEFDLLSQWRAYGSYAIEFDECKVKEYLPKLTTCQYTDTEKHNMAMKALADAVTTISQDLGENNGTCGVKAIDAYNKIVEIAAIFKNKGFSEEQEIRIFKQYNVDDSSIEYRAKGDLLIPYIELDIPLDCIKAIHIGPIQDQHLAKKSLNAFARKIEKNWQIETGNIEYSLNVGCSNIPYRG